MFRNPLYTESVDDTNIVQLLSLVLKSSLSCGTIAQGNIVYEILEVCCDTPKHHRLVGKALYKDILPFLKKCIEDEDTPEMQPIAFDTLKQYYHQFAEVKVPSFIFFVPHSNKIITNSLTFAKSVSQNLTVELINRNGENALNENQPAEWITSVIPLILERTTLGLQALEFLEQIGRDVYKIPEKRN